MKMTPSYIRYPKLLLLILSFGVAVVLFYEGKTYQPVHDFLISLDYAGILLAGAMYAYGFTAAPATAILLVIAKEQNQFLAILLGGFGALLSDLVIFLFLKHTFIDEMNQLSDEKLFRHAKQKVQRFFPRYVVISFAGFLIASPLPTEIGITLLAALKSLSVKKFMLIAYPLHTAGISVVILTSNLI